MSAERKPRAPAPATAGIRSNRSGGLPNGPLRTRDSRAIYPARQGVPTGIRAQTVSRRAYYLAAVCPCRDGIVTGKRSE